MRRFFVDEISGDKLVIKGPEAMHISRVLRMDEGDMFYLFDGSGTDYTAVIKEIGDAGVAVQITGSEKSGREPKVELIIFQAVIKNDNMDYVTQKCTELGVAKIVPFISARCVKRPDGSASEKLVTRQKRIALEAAKQCGRSRVPEVGGVIEFGQLTEEIGGVFTLLAYEDEDVVTIKRALHWFDGKSMAIIIGPEGGFEKTEADTLKVAGAKPCSLGKLILRAETAGPAALAMAMYELMGDTL